MSCANLGNEKSINVLLLIFLASGFFIYKWNFF